MRKLVFFIAVTLLLTAGAVGTITVMTLYPEQAIDTDSTAVASLHRAIR